MEDNERTCSYASNKLGQDSQSDVVSYQESLVHTILSITTQVGLGQRGSNEPNKLPLNPPMYYMHIRKMADGSGSGFVNYRETKTTQAENNN